MKIAINKIIPDANQPRKTFEDEHIENIKNSIHKHGFVSQIVVRPYNDKYMIIAGEYRWRAAKSAGLAEIECDIRQADDTDTREMQLIENYHRKDVPPLELAQAIKKLREKIGLSQRELGQRIGISDGRIKELEALCVAATQIQDYVKDNKLDSSTAYEITQIPDKNKQLEVAHLAAEDKLPRSRVRQIIANIKNEPDYVPEPKEIIKPEKTMLDIGFKLQRTISTLSQMLKEYDIAQIPEWKQQSVLDSLIQLNDAITAILKDKFVVIEGEVAK